MAASNSRSHRRGLLTFSLLTLVLAGAVGIGLWHLVAVNSLGSVSEQVARYSVVTGVMRGVAIGTLALGWPRLLAYLQRSARITASDQAVLLSARWRIVGWLLIIELLLGQQILTRFVGAWGASA